MTGRELSARMVPSLSLPVFERLAPALPPAELARWIESSTEPDEVVIDAFGRGGWVARTALALGRRALSLETTPLTRLLADVVVRPPDLRHLDAAFQSVGAASLGTSSVKPWITERFATRCPTCGRAIPLEEMTWEAPRAEGPLRPTRRVFRCAACLDKRGRGSELRNAKPTDDDIALAGAAEADPAVVDELRRRFPTQGRDGEALVEAILGLHSVRQLAGLNAILVRIEGDLRASQVTSALRLAFLHAILPASRLNSHPGRASSLRISGGQLRSAGSPGWRERNPWLAFEEGYALVRGFVQALDDGPLAAVQGRVTEPLDGLLDAAPMVSIRVATPDALDRLAEEGAALPSEGRARIRLALGQPPLDWTPARLAEAYVLTSWVLGSEAARLLPLGPLFDEAARPPARPPALRAALEGMAPALGPSAHAVVLLEPEGPVGLAAAALAGAGAGWRLGSARLAEPGDHPGGFVDLVPPAGRLGSGARTRANRSLPVAAGGAGDPGTIAGHGLFAGPQPIDGRYSSSEAAKTVTEAAVAILQARGEPSAPERMLGDLLVALDRSGQLRRYAVLTEAATSAGPSGGTAGGAASAGPGSPGAAARSAGTIPGPDAVPADGSAPGPDEELPAPPSSAAIRGLLELVDGELRRADNRRIAPSEGGELWLADPRDEAAAASPLSDRLEWAVFSLVGSGSPVAEPAIRDRLAEMFDGADAPDPWLVDACLASYAEPVGGHAHLRGRDDLQKRTAEHARTIALLVALGHRLGLRVAIAPREQARRVDGQPLVAHLERDEREPTLSFLGRAGADALEQVDCLWYVRPRFAFLFEVEWTAMLGEPILRRGRRIAPDDRVVRFLVSVPERTELIRAKLAHAPVVRKAFAEGNWHILRTDALRRLVALPNPSLDGLEPYLGLDPTANHADQLALFEASAEAGAAAPDEPGRAAGPAA